MTCSRVSVAVKCGQGLRNGELPHTRTRDHDLETGGCTDSHHGTGTVYRMGDIYSAYSSTAVG